ncbi:CaiF/GrlA family transcriptional regulator [Serratia marcescens]|uniref:CaiF/GrlA family transcriptional regulator n=1 Tax=Serratia marcescens TaxID=615 RepID=UPI00130E3D10|nr:CaiF/GrlA family transcriptional regulator [Serratia marcescens]
MKKKQEAPCVQEASSPLGEAGVIVMRGSEHTPLYKRVALWGWRLGKPFSRHDVAKTFGINLDSAGNVMSYLRRARPDVVKSWQWYERGARGSRKRYMQILSAPNVDGKPVRMMPVHLLGGKKEGSVQDMRRRFIRGAAVGLGED